MAGVGAARAHPASRALRATGRRCRRFDELGEPALDLTLTAGDCLYLPRGFPHAAETVESASSHLTIGIIAPSWQQAVRHAVDEAVADRRPP